MTGTEIVALVAWYAFIAVCILAFYLLSTMLSDAATLSMTGSCTGQGFTNITVEADLLVAAINQTMNGTTWQIWGGTGMSTEAGIYLFWICLFLGIFLILGAAQ